MAWLAGWGYRKQITITGQTGAGTDYQVSLNVGESSGSAGVDFHVEGHSLSFPSAKDIGGDLRFTDDTGTNLIDFWVESILDSTPNITAKIWIEISASLESNANIYIYYSNVDASNVSNGDNTFLLFDDFPGSTLDTTTNWTLQGGPPKTVASSILTLGTASSNNTWDGIVSKPSYFANRAVALRTLTQFQGVVGHNRSQIGFASLLGGYPGSTAHLLDYDGTMYYRNVDTINSDITETAYTRNTFYILDCEWCGTNVKSFKDGVLKATNALRIPTIDLPLRVGSGGKTGYNSSMAIDWLLIRKYQLTEPAYSTSGAEEDAGGESIRLIGGRIY